MTKNRLSATGFTLVEMLLTLAILALIVELGVLVFERFAGDGKKTELMRQVSPARISAIF